MNHKHVSAALALTGAGIIVLAGFGEEIAFQKIAIREEINKA